MSDLRDVLERGTEGFDPEAEGALERTLHRAARRSRNRRIAAGAVALSLTVAVVAGLWLAWFGGDRQEEVVPAVNPVEVARIHVGPIEGRPVFGEGRLWIATEDGIHAVHPERREVVLTVEDVRAPFAVGGGSVWASIPGTPPSLAQADAATGELSSVAELGTPLFGLGPDAEPLPPRLPVDIALRGEEIVIAADTTNGMFELQPAERIQVVEEVVELKAHGEVLWMRHADAVSARTSTGERTFEIPGEEVLAMAPSGREAWVVGEAAAYRVGLDREEEGALTRIIEFPPVSDALVVDGRLWVLAGAGEGPWDLRAYDLGTGEPIGTSLELGSGAHLPRLAFGAGLLWITDPAGEAVIAVDPSGQTEPDPVPQVTEEPKPEEGCPPPDLIPTWFPPGLTPTEPQPGLGGSADIQEPPTRGPRVIHYPVPAIHYGDSPGPDGGPAPFINILTWTADDHEVGPPHISPMTAREFGTPIEVPAGRGFLVSIEDGWGAILTDGDPPCNGLEITAYGVSRAHLRRVLEGLSVFRYYLVQPRDGLTKIGPRGWDTVEVLTERLLRVQFLARRDECNALDRVEVRETDQTVAITLFEGWLPGVEGCDDVGFWKAVDITLEAPLGGREIVDGAADGG